MFAGIENNDIKIGQIKKKYIKKIALQFKSILNSYTLVKDFISIHDGG